MPSIIVRPYPAQAFDTLVQNGLHPVLARVYAARGIETPHQLDASLSHLIPFQRLLNADVMAARLADAIQARRRLLIVADYDSDGATACAVGMRALQRFGATVGYLVPNRFEYGYGLTPEIVRLAAALPARPDVILTVDNGIASVEGVDEANRLGMQVFVTDHHLPGDRLPQAAVIVNPNQPGCGFPSKHLAGVGVMFYVMLALRAELRTRGRFAGSGGEPNLASLLDLVALGTVADVVKLDDNNRILVRQGLQRIRRGRGCAGIHALLQVARRDPRRTSTYDLGFAVGPRLNAAGRLDDMSLGIECLVTDDDARAARLAAQLDALNRQRREIESEMQDGALSMLAVLPAVGPQPDQAAEVSDGHQPCSLSLFDPGWHQGVIGILASRMKERFHRPVIVFAPAGHGEIKGSGRSIAGFHLRDALDLVSKRHPGLLLRFGGHAAAAGLTLRTGDFETFRDAFDAVARASLTPADLAQRIETDGMLDASELDAELARHLTDQAWGQGFAQPRFSARFSVALQRVVGEKHLKLKLGWCAHSTDGHGGTMAARLYEAMLFCHIAPLPETIDAVYRVEFNDFNGSTSLQLILDHWSAAAGE